MVSVGQILKQTTKNLLGRIVFLFGALAFSGFIFYWFPFLYRMVTNADSLVMLDFARDLLMGHSVVHWNLPRVPYLFPDLPIAIGIMLIGWFDPFSFYLIAVVNLLIIVGISTKVLRQGSGLNHLSLLQVGCWMGLSLLTMGILFPSSFYTLYWQIFASGAHFLSAAIVLLIMRLSEAWQAKPSSRMLFVVLIGLAVAEGLSNSMAALLLLIWCGAQWLSASHRSIRSRQDIFAVLIGVVVGTALSTLIPRQSLVDSFFSLDKFIAAATAFGVWLISDLSNVALLGSLLFLLVSFPIWLKKEFASSWREKLGALMKSPVLLPSIGVMLATPLFFQEPGSIRYLAFPALIGLLSLSVIYVRTWQWLRNNRARNSLLIGFGTCFFGLAWWQVEHDRIGPRAAKEIGKDMIGLAFGAQTKLALACLEQAKTQVNLQDGVATYWNARPTRFVTNFEYFFAQINPWRPRSGMMVWGNNPIDFVYRDLNSHQRRNYNFVLATRHEIESRLWGSLPTQSSKLFTCPAHTILYFDRPTVLWEYLFPLGVPAQYIASAADETIVNPQRVRIFPADDFFTIVGERKGLTLVPTGKSGFLAYGPYIPLPAGHYRIIARGQLQNPDGDNGVLDVSTQFGKSIVASQSFFIPKIRGSASSALQNFEIAQLDFKLAKTTSDIEFRLQVPKNTQGQLIEFELQRLD